MLDKEIERQGLGSRELLKAENVQSVLAHFAVQSDDDLFAAIGYGHVAAMTVITRLKATQPPPDELTITGRRPTGEAKLGIVAGGVDGIAIRRSKCCTPIPGDEVMGYVTRGRGITLHRRGCPNLVAYAEREPDRLIEVEWGHANGERFRTGLHIEAMDRVGLLNDISAIFSESKTNICSAKIKSFPNKTAAFDLVVELDDVGHLNALITTVGNLTDILEVRRAIVADEETPQ
jgi:GTP pyrophosphokinase